MFLMLAEAMHLMNVRRAFPGNRFWEFVAFNTARAVAGLLAARSDSACVLVPGRRGDGVLNR